MSTWALPTNRGEYPPNFYPDEWVDNSEPLTGLSFGAEGELLISGFDAKLLRYSRADAVGESAREAELEDFHLEVTPGTDTAAIAHNLRLGLDGSFWSTDGNVVLRFDQAGRVTAVFGDVQGNGRIAQSLTVEIDVDGWIYLGSVRPSRYDSPGGIWAVDALGDGRRLYSLPVDAEHSSWASPVLSSTSQGELTLARWSGATFESDKASWKLSAEGKLVDLVHHGLFGAISVVVPGEANPDLYVGFTENRNRDSHRLVVLDDQLRTLASSTRRPNGDFYGDIGLIRAGSRGTLAVEELGSGYFGAGPLLVTVTTPAMLTGKTFGLPEKSGTLASVSAPWLAFTENLLINAETEQHFRYALPPELKDVELCGHGLSPDGDELWLIGRTPLTLYRCSLPVE